MYLIYAEAGAVSNQRESDTSYTSVFFDMIISTYPIGGMKAQQANSLSGCRSSKKS